MNTVAGFAVLVLVSAAVVGVAAAVPSLHPADESGPIFSVQFVRTGGFAGVHDTLTIGDGMAAYSSRSGSNFNATLTQSEFSSLRDTIITNMGTLQLSVIHPRTGIADYFSYDMTATINGQTTHLSWVDGWASLEPFPQGLQIIQQALQGTIQAHS